MQPHRTPCRKSKLLAHARTHATAGLKPSTFIAILILVVVGCKDTPQQQPADDRDVSSAESSLPDFQDGITASPSTTMPDAIRDDYWHSEFQRINQAVAKAGHARHPAGEGPDVVEQVQENKPNPCQLQLPGRRSGFS